MCVNPYLSRPEIITLLYLRMRMHVMSPESYRSPYFSFSVGHIACPHSESLRKLFLLLCPFFPPSLLHFNLCFSKAGCSTSEIPRRSFCVCVCPVGIHVARQINNYRLSEYTTLQGEKRPFLECLMSNMRGTKITLGEKKKAALVCIFSRFVDIVSCYYYVWRYGYA